MKVFIASDHAGYVLKEVLIPYLEGLGHEVEDVGAHTPEPEDDYPDYILPCARMVVRAESAFGVVIGGSGQGEAMVANRVPGIRAAVFYGGREARVATDAVGTPSTDVLDIVRLARLHNNANVISLGARFLSNDEAQEAVRIFLETSFSGDEKHIRRIGKF